MGGEQSVEPVIIDVVTTQKEKQVPNNYTKYLDIPEVEPLIEKHILENKYPEELSIPSGRLPDAQQLMKTYYHCLSSSVNKNEKAISFHIQRQLANLTEIAMRYKIRKEKLSENVKHVMDIFQSLDNEVKETTDALVIAMRKADMLAKAIDPEIPKFSEYNANE